MAIGDLYFLRDQYTVLGENAENRYFISQIAGGSGFAQLAVAWVAGPQVNVKSIQSSAAVYVQLDIVNNDDTTDFGIVGTAGAGVRVGQALPPYAAWAFRLQTTDRRVRTGTKRFGGVSEDDQAGGIRDAGVIASMDGLENALESTFSAGGDVYEVVLWTPGNGATGGLPLQVPISVVRFASLSTQSSRKYA